MLRRPRLRLFSWVEYQVPEEHIFISLARYSSWKCCHFGWPSVRTLKEECNRASRSAAASPAPALALLIIVAPFGPDSSPLSGTIAGVNSLGQTTFIVSDSTVESNAPLIVTGSLTTRAAIIKLAVTFVGGSDYLSYILALPGGTATLGAACGLTDGAAVCTEALNGAVKTRETISAPGPLVDDVAPTAAPTASGGGGSSAPAPT
ncbi:hypothetical protein FB451DRAFT_1181365 [Mycena latifolia]|nr:hypothetical protein FB451DRAFT_1181365 [Mycena latifolia]